MARRPRSLGDLPPDVLLKIAGGCEVIEDIFALRASCRRARAALDARGWCQLTIARFGAAAAGDVGDSLEEATRRFRGLESPVLRMHQLEQSAAKEEDEDMMLNASSLRQYVVHFIWTFRLTGVFEAVWPGTYVLVGSAHGSIPEGLVVDAMLAWQREPEPGQEARRVNVKREMEMEGEDFDIAGQLVLVGEAGAPFETGSQRSQQPVSVTCKLIAESHGSTLDDEPDWLHFSSLHLRRVRRQQA